MLVSKRSGRRVLVTGGAGFLGSHLCERLIDRGDDVLCVDNYFTGSRENIAQLISSPRFEALRHDVTFPLYVEVDEIFNLAKSEEHTSELQSLMRISYAVFCLKKKKTQ